MDIEKVLDEVMHVIRKNVDYFNEASLELKIEEALKKLESTKPVNVDLADVSDIKCKKCGSVDIRTEEDTYWCCDCKEVYYR